MTKQFMKEKLLQKFSKLSLEECCWSESNGRTGDIDQLEASELEKVFLLFFPKQKTSAEIIQEQSLEKYIKKMRSIILKDAHYIGLYDPQDWASFNKWMLERSPLKKQLNHYKADEFEPLIKQFKSLRSKYEKLARIPYTKEWCHKNKFPIPSAN